MSFRIEIDLPEKENVPECNLQRRLCLLNNSIERAYRNKTSRRMFNVIVTLFVVYYLRMWLIFGWEIPDQNLNHLRRTRKLWDYIEHVDILVQPRIFCNSREKTPLIAMVASFPTNRERRDAIRKTWGKQITAYFVMGRSVDEDGEFVSTYDEHTENEDILMFNFDDHYQNLTVKTALMIQWMTRYCPNVYFMYKLDDDVLINPWRLNEVLMAHLEAPLLGYALNGTSVYRGDDQKWYLPKWLYGNDTIPQFLSGPGYLINGYYMKSLLDQAKKVPMINLEDVYFTHLVPSTYNVNKEHDSRLGPYRPWPPWYTNICEYWLQASAHSLTPEEMLYIWPQIEQLSLRFSKGDKKICSFYEKYVRRFVPMYF